MAGRMGLLGVLREESHREVSLETDLFYNSRLYVYICVCVLIAMRNQEKSGSQVMKELRRAFGCLKGLRWHKLSSELSRASQETADLQIFNRDTWNVRPELEWVSNKWVLRKMETSGNSLAFDWIKMFCLFLLSVGRYSFTQRLYMFLIHDFCYSLKMSVDILVYITKNYTNRQSSY